LIDSVILFNYKIFTSTKIKDEKNNFIAKTDSSFADVKDINKKRMPKSFKNRVGNKINI